MSARASHCSWAPATLVHESATLVSVPVIDDLYQRSRAASRPLVWLSWVAMLVVVGLCVQRIREPTFGIRELWPVYLRWSGLAALLLAPLLGRVRATTPNRGSSLLIGAVGLVTLTLLWCADVTALGLARVIGYSAFAWVPLVLRAQAEACWLLARRDSDAMWLRQRRLGLGLGVLLSFVAAELLLFVAVRWQASHVQELQLLGLMLAFLLFEAWTRISQPAEPRFEVPRWSDAISGRHWPALDQPLPDAVALQRGYDALRFGRASGGVVIASGAIVFGMIVVTAIERSLWHFPGLAVCLMVSFGAVAVVMAPRPRPDRRRQPPAPTHGLPLRLRSLLDQLEQLRTMIEQGLDDTAWELSLALEAELRSLTEVERELLERRRAQPESLVAALRAARPGLEVLGAGPRRALHAALIQFIACAEGRAGEHPYRHAGGDIHRDGSRDEAQDAALRIPTAWMVGMLGLGCGLGAVLIVFPQSMVIAAAVIGMLARAVALAHARRMFELAVPKRHADNASRYSVAFERERARVSRGRRWASVIATIAAAGLYFTIVAVFVWAASEVWFRPAGRLRVADVDWLLALNLLAAVLLLVPWLRDRLRERPIVAMVRRLHRAPTVAGSAVVLTEWVAQRIAWAERPQVCIDALERCAALLCATTELGALSPGDRECLLGRLDHAIARGPALDRQSRRDLELDLVTAEQRFLVTEP
jgi:hypothetical protein